MVTAGIFPFMENSHGRAGNGTRDLMISNQSFWPLDHDAGRNKDIYICIFDWLYTHWLLPTMDLSNERNK